MADRDLIQTSAQRDLLLSLPADGSQITPSDLYGFDGLAIPADITGDERRALIDRLNAAAQLRDRGLIRQETVTRPLSLSVEGQRALDGLPAAGGPMPALTVSDAVALLADAPDLTPPFHGNYDPAEGYDDGYEHGFDNGVEQTLTWVRQVLDRVR